MIGQVAIDLGGDVAIGWLIVAAVAGSVLSDIATNFYVWQRGILLVNGERLRREFPYGLRAPSVVVAAMLRAVLAAFVVGLLAWCLDRLTGSVFGPLTAACLGALAPAGLSMVAGVRGTGSSAPEV
jgi:hypothetical protein